MDSSAHIIFVDDEFFIGKTVKKLLGKLEAQIHIFQDPIKALDFAEKLDELAVFISDYYLPNMNGIRLLNQIHTIHPLAHRILISGHMDLSLAKKAVNGYGINQIIDKPWSPRNFIAAVDKGLQQYQEQCCSQVNDDIDVEKVSHLSPSNIRSITADGMLAMLGLRDKETKNHSRRVTEYSLILGRAAKLQDHQLDDLRLGAMLHDIGKVGIPDSILLKPAPLTEKERLCMQQHPILGVEILKNIDMLQGARKVVASHHENYDGTGYPHHHKDQQIPIEARIFSIVDTLDAMTSDRPYRKNLPIEAVYQELENGGGSQFDPHLVEIFFSIPPQTWLDIKKAYKDPAIKVVTNAEMHTQSRSRS